MKIHKKTKLNKTNITNTSSNNKSLTSTKLVSRKILNKLILKGGNYVRNYNVSSDHNKKTQKQNGDLKRTLTALKQKKYFTKSQKQDGGFIIDSIRLKFKIRKFKSFLKKYRKEEKNIQKYIDSYKGKTNILESLKDKKIDKSREYIIHYRKLKLFEMITKNKDNEKDVKTSDIDNQILDVKSKLKGIEKSLKQYEKEQKNEIPNLKKQTKTFKKNSKKISKLIAYFEKHLRKYYDEIDMIRANYKEFQGKKKLDSEAKSKIKKYQRFARDIEYILSFTDIEQKTMIDLKSKIDTILDQGATYSKNFKEFDKTKFNENLEKWKENYTRLYENLDIIDNIDEIIETYKVIINNFESFRNQLSIIDINKKYSGSIDKITSFISILNNQLKDLEKESLYIEQLKQALLLEKTFKDVDISITILLKRINIIIDDNKKILKEVTLFDTSIKNILSTSSSVVGGAVSIPTKGIFNINKLPSYDPYTILTYDKFINTHYRDITNIFNYFIQIITSQTLTFGTNNQENLDKFFEKTIEIQLNSLKQCLTIYLYLAVWAYGQTNKNTTNFEFNTQTIINKNFLQFMIKLIFIYELLNYKNVNLNDKKYEIVKEKLTDLMKGLKDTEIILDVNNIKLQLLTNRLHEGTHNRNKLITIKSDNTTVDDLITKKLDKNQTSMASYTISNIMLSVKPSLQLKETIKDPEFIINLISNDATKQNFETFYKEKNISGAGNLQDEIEKWFTPNNQFQKLLALIILHIRLYDNDPKATLDVNIKTDIETIITKINNGDNIDRIDINKLFTKTQSNNGSKLNLNDNLLGTTSSSGTLSSGIISSSGTSSSGTSSSSTSSSGTPSLGVKLTQPITTGFINIDLSKLKTIPNSSTIIETIENNTSEIVNNMEKITPDSDSTQIPEVFNTIITKLTIINECITNLKLIEPTFDIENVKYKKLILEYNWLKKSFTKEGTFGATNNIVKMETEFKDRKQIVSSSNTKSKYNSADYYKIITIRGSLSEEQRKSVDKLKSESNIKQFIDDLNSNIKDQNDRCITVEPLLRNASTINIPGLLQALTNYKSTNCQNKGQGQGQGQRQGQGQGQWQGQKPGYGQGYGQGYGSG